MKRYLAIDPGAGGGLAWFDTDGNVASDVMPEGMTAQADRVRALKVGGYITHVIMERVGGYMPGNSGPAAVKFARHCGHLEAICYVMGLPITYVAPQTWQKAIGTYSKEKAERKRQIKEQMARLYPHLDVTLKTADALGILTWVIRNNQC